MAETPSGYFPSIWFQWDVRVVRRFKTDIRTARSFRQQRRKVVDRKFRSILGTSADLTVADQKILHDFFDRAPEALWPHVSNTERLNRAIAVAELRGPAEDLTLVDDLELGDYHLWHATRGDLLERLGRIDEAMQAFEQARDRTDHAAEQAFLEGRIAALVLH